MLDVGCAYARIFGITIGRPRNAELESSEIRERLNSIVRHGPVDAVSHQLVAAIIDTAVREASTAVDMTQPIVVRFAPALDVTFMADNRTVVEIAHIPTEYDGYHSSRNVINISGMLFELFYNIDHVVALRLSGSAYAKFMKETNKPISGLKSRWPEDSRPNKQVKLRLDPALLEEVQKRADEEGLNRTEWISSALRKALARKPKP